MQSVLQKVGKSKPHIEIKVCDMQWHKQKLIIGGNHGFKTNVIIIKTIPI
jgi:hypothetical protein